MSLPVALQLYSVREAASKDYAAAVRRIAGFGYDGVEPAYTPGFDAQAAGRLYRELGLRVPSTHTPLPLGAQGQQIFDDMRAIGCTRIITGFGPDQFKTPDLVKASCDLFNQAYEACKANGFTFGLHNHWWEYQKVEGRYVYQMMDELLDPAIQFEMDTYWVKTAGVDPAVAIEELGQRVTLLHVKDGPAVRDAPMTAVGEGVLDFPVIIKAATYTEWLIVELDRCATDMFEAVRKSVEYLKKIQ